MIQSTSSMDQVVVRAKGLSRRAKILLTMSAVLALGLAAAAPSIGRWAKAERAVDISRLRLARVTRGDLQRDLAIQGTIAAAFHPRLFSPSPGIVTLHARAGDLVKKGSLLATIQSPELASRLEQEQATLQSIKSELASSEIAGRQSTIQNEQDIELREVRAAATGRDLERSQRLFDEGLLNKTDYEKAKDEVTIAAVELKNARRSADLSKETLEVALHNRRLQVERQESVVRELVRRVAELKIEAPFDGMVANVDVQDKDAVAFNQPLLMVVNLSTYEVKISVPENYAPDVKPGTPASILVDGKEYEGHVTSISPEVRQSEVEGVVAFSGTAPAGLKQNQRVSTRLILDSRVNILKVPRGPFVESGGGRKVYVVEDGLATLREITVGAVSISEVEIVTGLAEGEQIILSDTNRFEGAGTLLVRQ